MSGQNYESGRYSSGEEEGKTGRVNLTYYLLALAAGVLALVLFYLIFKYWAERRGGGGSLVFDREARFKLY